MPTTSEDLISIGTFLADTRLFGSLSFNEVLMLAASATTYRCPAGALIFALGDPGDSLYLIRRGSVRIFLPLDRDEKTTTLAVMYPGDLFGELSLLDGKPRSASACAIDDLEAITLGREDFLKCLRKQPEAAIRILAVLTARLRNTDRLLAEALFLEGPMRLARHLAQLAEGTGNGEGCTLHFRDTCTDLAEYLESTTGRVEGYLNWLQERGLVEYDETQVTVRNAMALTRLGE